MLKIKDEVSYETLKEFGLKMPKNEAFYTKRAGSYNINIDRRPWNKIRGEITINNIDKKTLSKLDILYDLIQAGLVEKV